MANITRFSPIDEAFDELFRGFFVRPISVEGQNTPAQFRVDVAENDSGYRVQAEIPGVKKEDINISIDGEHVAISAEVKREKDVKDGERLVRAERYHGKVYRTFTLDQPVDEAAAQARYENGVLEVTLPKKAAVAAKRITVQ
ncbi:MAG TPA: Hsp20/alpha crystallin family protein [Burkholderiales bacterium]|nr:Hsp20/alpha crystallin family protein [Burkholderiales bacterium]